MTTIFFIDDKLLLHFFCLVVYWKTWSASTFPAISLRQQLVRLHRSYVQTCGSTVSWPYCPVQNMVRLSFTLLGSLKAVSWRSLHLLPHRSIFCRTESYVQSIHWHSLVHILQNVHHQLFVHRLFRHQKPCCTILSWRSLPPKLAKTSSGMFSVVDASSLWRFSFCPINSNAHTFITTVVLFSSVSCLESPADSP